MAPAASESSLRDDTLEHAVRSREAFDLFLHRSRILAIDRLPRLVDDRLRLLDGVATEVRRRDDLLHLREELLDLRDELLGLLLRALELLGRAPVDEVVLRVVHHRLDL